MSNLTGQSLGRYHILEQLGEGGMATVYKAYDTRLETDVAVKVIRTDVLPQNAVERTLKRFEREAKSLARLTHPNIVKVMDYGEYNGAPYLILVYLPGGTLKERMMGKPMPWQEAVRLLIPIANALDYAHEQKIIHRDVKPANILLTVKGQPMLSDFGIAKILEMEDGHTLTGTGMGVGTPEYMAPEQGMGRDVDGRADIYSLGIIFYELITGHKPYSADTPMAVILKHMTDPLPRPRQYAANLPDAVERVLLKALAKDPKDRYADAGAFATAMENLTGGNQPRAIANEQPAREMDDSSETMDTFATNLQTVPETDTRQKAPVRRTPTPISKPKTKFPLLGIGLVAFAVLTWIIWGLLSPPASTSTLGIGSTMIGKDGATLVYVPEGEFTMGSNADDALAECQKISTDCERGWFTNEEPPHSVSLDAFWIDQTEVTNQQYAACVSGGGCAPPFDTSSYTHTSYYGNSEFDKFPVVYVDWNQANTYCSWAGRRLPTEAEWEKAARGTDARIYPWGNAALNDTLLNYNQNVGDTTKVGNYKIGKSICGAYDMAGNAWEWVSSLYKPYPYDATDGREDMSSLDLRVLRGGSWKYDYYYVRSATRGRTYPTDTDDQVGFRCARSLP